jgi:hypothetical protein
MNTFLNYKLWGNAIKTWFIAPGIIAITDFREFTNS